MSPTEIEFYKYFCKCYRCKKYFKIPDDLKRMVREYDMDGSCFEIFCSTCKTEFVKEVCNVYRFRR